MSSIIGFCAVLLPAASAVMPIESSLIQADSLGAAQSVAPAGTQTKNKKNIEKTTFEHFFIFTFDILSFF